MQQEAAARPSNGLVPLRAPGASDPHLSGEPLNSGPQTLFKNKLIN